MTGVELGYVAIQRAAGEPPPATDEDAFANLTTAFPDARVLPFEPKLRVLEEADAVLADDSDRSSWRAVHLGEHLAPDDGRDAPSLLNRSDRRAMLYERKRNEIHGAYESGKSWVALIVALEVMRRGGIVVWVDFEDAPRSVVGRLLALGATEDEIFTRFRYVQPVEPLTAATEIDLRLELHGSELVVIDAANEAMAAAGFDPNVNKDIAQWYRTIPRLASEAGATVVVLDHVAKDPDRQRGAVGGAHKQAAIDGASYRIDAVSPFGRGTTGVLRLRLAKDRPGYVRGLLGSGREPVAAEIAFDATDPTAIAVDVRPPGSPDQPFQPTLLMERVSRWVEGAPEPVSQRDILDGVTGKREFLATAIAELVRGGYLKRSEGARGAHLHTSERPFREGPS